MAKAIPKKNRISGGIVFVSQSPGEELARGTNAILRALHLDTRRQIESLFKKSGVAMDSDEIPRSSSRSSFATNAKAMFSLLSKKYGAIFKKWARAGIQKMIAKSLRDSAAKLNIATKSMGEPISEVRMDRINPRVNEIVKAASIEAANRIVTLPQSYLNDVANATMNSIVSGRGLADLIPFMQKSYKQKSVKAESVALDQTRKVINAINAARMKNAGITQFEWIHSGRSGIHARKQHQEWNGKIFGFDDLPVDKDFGPVIPGQAINCHCVMRPVVVIGIEENKK